MHPRSVLRLESVGPWLEQHGFYAGDRGLIAAALERPWLTFEGQDLYPDVWSKAAALLVGVISTRPFVDGINEPVCCSRCLFCAHTGCR